MLTHLNPSARWHTGVLYHQFPAFLKTDTNLSSAAVTKQYPLNVINRAFDTYLRISLHIKLDLYCSFSGPQSPGDVPLKQEHIKNTLYKTTWPLQPRLPVTGVLDLRFTLGVWLGYPLNTLNTLTRRAAELLLLTHVSLLLPVPSVYMEFCYDTFSINEKRWEKWKRERKKEFTGINLPFICCMYSVHVCDIFYRHGH